MRCYRLQTFGRQHTFAEDILSLSVINIGQLTVAVDSMHTWLVAKEQPAQKY